MSDTKKQIKSGRKSHKPNPLGVCRCLQCKSLKSGRRSARSKALIDSIKKHNRRALKEGREEDIKRGYYYA
jgi:hypothetical protein